MHHAAQRVVDVWIRARLVQHDLARARTLRGRVVAQAPPHATTMVIATIDRSHMTTSCSGCPVNTVIRQFASPQPFELELAPGTYQVWADVSGAGGTKPRTIEVRTGASADAGTFDIASPTASLSGRVHEASGKPAAVPTVYLQRWAVAEQVGGIPDEPAREIAVGRDGRFTASGLALGDYQITFGEEAADVAIDRPSTTVDLVWDPQYSRSCRTCGPDPSEEPPCSPAFEVVENVIRGPAISSVPGVDLTMPDGVMPGDVLEAAGDHPGVERLSGKRGTRVRLRLLRPGTGARLTVTVKRTIPEW